LSTGIAIELPKGYVGMIHGRSSAVKHGLTILTGVLDSDFRGEVIVVAKGIPNISDIDLIGKRLGQLVVHKLPDIEVEEVAELSLTERGAGGFGSTDCDFSKIQELHKELSGKIKPKKKVVKENLYGVDGWCKEGDDFCDNGSCS
jgi:hypothetical protein